MHKRILAMLWLVMAMALVASALSARADGVDTPRFEGLYAGFSTTGGYGESTWTGGGGSPSDRLHLSGRGGGAILGYGWREGRTLYGLALDLTAAQVSGRAHGGVCAAGCDTTLERYAGLRGQIGQRVGEDGHLYGFAGLAWGRIDLNPSGLSRQHADTRGWLAGVGYERALEDGWSWRLEAQVMGFEDVSYTAAGPARRIGLDQVGLMRLGLVRWF